jgi:CheY-like chemotaxis protein
LDGGTSRRALEIIDRNAQSQVKLVADILEVSRIITGKLRLDIRPVDLGSIIGSVLDGVRPAADAKQIRIRSTLMPSARLTAGDPQRLQQIVWNLVSNAMKFTPQGGTISLELADGGPALVSIRVTDTGMGISPEFLTHVFERFRQADSSTTRQHGGLGLGLAIVRHLVELHGGTVRAESEGLGKGAAFVVELPKMIDDAAPRLEPARTQSVEALAAVGEHPLSGCRVLVVEDDDDARELLAALLKQFGADVDTARSVEGALDVLVRIWPDVLISDIGFAERDGYALIREVRTLETRGRARLPAAAVTAYARQEDSDRALAAGFDRYVSKPIQAKTMIETVRELWKGRA